MPPSTDRLRWAGLKCHRGEKRQRRSHSQVQRPLQRRQPRYLPWLPARGPSVGPYTVPRPAQVVAAADSSGPPAAAGGLAAEQLAEGVVERSHVVYHILDPLRRAQLCPLTPPGWRRAPAPPRRRPPTRRCHRGWWWRRRQESGCGVLGSIAGRHAPPQIRLVPARGQRQPGAASGAGEAASGMVWTGPATQVASVDACALLTRILSVSFVTTRARPTAPAQHLTGASNTGSPCVRSPSLTSSPDMRAASG